MLLTELDDEQTIQMAAMLFGSESLDEEIENVFKEKSQGNRVRI